MSLPDDLEDRIEDTRITYPERAGGVTIRGSAFTCDFHDPVDPEAFCETICTAEDPWQMFGIKSKISDDYWKVVGNLFHVVDDALVDASKISLEVAPEYVRVYVKEDCSAERVVEFLHDLDDEYGIDVVFAGDDDQDQD